MSLLTILDLFKAGKCNIAFVSNNPEMMIQYVYEKLQIEKYLESINATENEELMNSSNPPIHLSTKKLFNDIESNTSTTTASDNNICNNKDIIGIITLQDVIQKIFSLHEPYEDNLHNKYSRFYSPMKTPIKTTTNINNNKSTNWFHSPIKNNYESFNITEIPKETDNLLPK